MEEHKGDVSLPRIKRTVHKVMTRYSQDRFYRKIDLIIKVLRKLKMQPTRNTKQRIRALINSWINENAIKAAIDSKKGILDKLGRDKETILLNTLNTLIALNEESKTKNERNDQEITNKEKKESNEKSEQEITNKKKKESSEKSEQEITNKERKESDENNKQEITNKEKKQSNEMNEQKPTNNKIEHTESEVVILSIKRKNNNVTRDAKVLTPPPAIPIGSIKRKSPIPVIDLTNENVIAKKEEVITVSDNENVDEENFDLDKFLNSIIFPTMIQPPATPYFTMPYYPFYSNMAGAYNSNYANGNQYNPFFPNFIYNPYAGTNHQQVFYNPQSLNSNNDIQVYD